MKSVLIKIAACTIPVILYLVKVPLYLDLLAWGIIGAIIIWLLLKNRMGTRGEESSPIQTESPLQTSYGTKYVTDYEHLSESNTEPLIQNLCQSCGQSLQARLSNSDHNKPQRVNAMR